MSAFFGYSGLVELATEVSYDKRRAATYVRKWRGTSAEVLTFANTLKTAGIRFQIDPPASGGYWHVSAFYAYDSENPDEILTDRWTLEGEDVEMSLMELPQTQQIFEAVASGWPDEARRGPRRLLRRMLEAYDACQDTLEAVNPWLQSAGESTDIPTTTTWSITEARILYLAATDVPEGFGLPPEMVDRLEQLLGAMARGVKAKRITTWVLNRTIVVTDIADLHISAENTNKIYTPAQLLVEQQMQSCIKSVLPTTGFWLKSSPTQTDLENSKIQINQKWIWSEWYDPYCYERVA